MRNFVLTLLLASVIISGCSGVFKSGELTTTGITVAKIKHRVEKNFLKLQTIKAKARISVESPMISFIANSNIHIKKPDSLLIQLKVGFGFGVGSVFIDSHLFKLYNSMENTVYFGDPNEMNLGRLLQIDLKLDDLIQTFAGGRIVPSLGKDSLSIDDNKYLITSYSSSQILKYWIDPKNYVIHKSELSDNAGNVLLKFEFTQFQKKDGIYVPKIIRVFKPKDTSRLTVFYTDFKPNYKFNKKDFVLEVPENVEKIPL